MIKTITIFSLLALLTQGFSQQARQITELSSDMKETSGLLIVDGEFYTFNDSGGEPELYKIDTTTGKVKETIPVKGAGNRDWEAITADDQFIYIGDIGNNKGKRTDLVIYKCPIGGLNKGTLKAESIEISYADQEDFDHKKYKHGFDGESLFIKDEQLYLVSKNWKEDKSKIYNVPKAPGSYKLDFSSKIDVFGKVTDTYYSSGEKALYLIGYGDFPFITRRGEFEEKDFISEITLPINSPNGFQTEGIFVSDEMVYFTSEKVNVFAAELASFTTADFTDLVTFIVKESRIKITSEEKILSIKVESLDGKELLKIKEIGKKGKKIPTRSLSIEDSVVVTVKIKGGAIYKRKLIL